MKTTSIAVFAALWRFIFWMWNILIIGAIVGIFGNASFTYFTTGSINFKDPRTLAVAMWFNAHIVPCVLIFIFILLVTFCSFLAHLQQQRKAQEYQQKHEESLIILARGVQQALDERSHTNLPKPSTVETVETANLETLPPTIWHVPYRRNPFFTGREQLLTTLHNNLTAGKATALIQAQAINGLGGIGKTQVAIEYAYRYREDYHYTFWVNAATHETLITDYATIAHLLQLPSQNEQDQNIVITAVKSWFTTHKDCLLILDNADELTIIDPFLPTENTCHILITTREQTTNPLAQPIEVEKMASQEGILMLLRRASILSPDNVLDQAKREDMETAEQIVRTMDGLPLALDQAGAYIEKTYCTLPTYLHAYKQRQADLLHQRGTYSMYHTEPVATTWSLSFEQVEKRNPLAADLLRCCAFLAPDDIPEEFFTEGANEFSPLLQAIRNDSSLLDEAIGELRRFSLVRRNQDNHTFSIHRLVQASLKASLDERTQQVWTERAVHMVNHLFPDEDEIDVTNWKQCQRYVTHAQTCATFIETYQLTSPEAASLLNKTADYLLDLALYPEAEPLYQQALRIREQVLGPEHPDTAQSLHNLAMLYNHQGKYEQAEPLYQRALSICEQVLGPEHLDTALCLNNLAFLYLSQGKYEQAEPLYQRALHIREQRLGPEHPDTKTTQNTYEIFLNEMKSKKSGSERNQKSGADG